MKRKTIAILFGGHSSEYEVSLQSAAAVIRHIDSEKYNLLLIGITKEGDWFRFRGTPDEIEQDIWRKGNCTPAFIAPDRSVHGVIELCKNGIRTVYLDAAFPILHGKFGEDGTVQGLLALAGIPCIGCGLLSSALCMDKDTAHKLAAAAGIRVPASVVIDKMGDAVSLQRWTSHLHYPLFVKPVNAGSSFGITRITEVSQLSDAVVHAFSHDTSVIIEEAIEGFEVGCAVLGKEQLITGAVDEIELSGVFFDFDEKYTLKTSKIHMPARIDEVTAHRIRQTAQKLYRLLHCSGFARVDCFLTPEGEIVFNEINTIPGFTAHSRYPNMMSGIGMSFEEIVNRLIEMEVP